MTELEFEPGEPGVKIHTLSHHTKTNQGKKERSRRIKKEEGGKKEENLGSLML